MIRHFGVAHKKVKEAIAAEHLPIVGKYIPEAEMAPCRPAKNSYGVMPPQPQEPQQPVYEPAPPPRPSTDGPV